MLASVVKEYDEKNGRTESTQSELERIVEVRSAARSSVVKLDSNDVLIIPLDDVNDTNHVES